MPDFRWNHQFADLPDLRVHYVRHGQGKPVVFLHGWPEFWYTWKHIIPEMSRHCDAIAPDLRGFGDTEKPKTVGTVDSYVDDLKHLLDHLGLAQVSLVSHDVGAWVAQGFTRRFPERVRSLFFFNCPHPGIAERWADAEHLKEVWYQFFHQLDVGTQLVGYNRETCRIYFKYILAHWSHDPHAFDAELEAWVDNFMKPGNLQGGFDWYKASNAPRLKTIRDGAPVLPKITQPTRVFWGESDKVLKASFTDRLPNYFADLEVDIAKGAGHFVHIEKPAESIRELIAFFTGRGA